MTKHLTVAGIAVVVSLGVLGAAHAQVAVPAGQDFYATPMNTGNMTMMMPPARIAAAAPAAAAPMAAPMKKHRMMKRKKMM